MRTLLAILVLYPAIAHAADPLLVAQIVVCESSSRPNVCGDDGISCGIAQFQRRTFFYMAKLAIKQGKWDYKLLGSPRWMDYGQQTFLLDWALDNRLGWNWTCWHKLKGHQK